MEKQLVKVWEGKVNHIIDTVVSNRPLFQSLLDALLLLDKGQVHKNRALTSYKSVTKMFVDICYWFWHNPNLPESAMPLPASGSDYTDQNHISESLNSDVNVITLITLVK